MSAFRVESRGVSSSEVGQQKTKNSLHEGVTTGLLLPRDLPLTDASAKTALMSSLFAMRTVGAQWSAVVGDFQTAREIALRTLEPHILVGGPDRHRHQVDRMFGHSGSDPN